MNRVPDAETVLAAALKRNPKNADALLQRAAPSADTGKPDKPKRP